MPRPDPQRSIDEARQSFDAVLHTPEFERVHADDAHRNLLIDYLAVTPGGRYLDLGTGNGYAAFGIAARHPDCRVTGIDIADNAIARNVELARENGLASVECRRLHQPFPGPEARWSRAHSYRGIRQSAAGSGIDS
ncbi:MAG: methyltransferase domain-containing protein [Betaproteobacteria bacterium]|nr:methyltransferase domain-containing protein [Betaproteobacteria bacterium]MDH5537245.1 methyltransferase domain-containing protein [Betaproteobacteria bacterium]